MNGGDWYVKGDARQRADVDRLLAHCRRLPLIIDVSDAGSSNIVYSEKMGDRVMRQFSKSTKLDNVLYDVRGPVVEERCV